METISVNVENLKLGVIIAEDIFANTQNPIIRKDTKITYEHFHIFNAFNITKVSVLTEQGNSPIDSTDSIGELPNTYNKAQLSTEVPFEEKYIHAVSQYKREFQNWESGAKVDITKVRTIILPLVEKILEDRSILFDLNNYSNPNEYLFHHCIATGLISATISNKLGYDRGYVLQMALAGALADCGMAKVSSRIRKKKEALTEQEFGEIRKHPIHSYKMVRDLPALKEEMKVAIYQHHERLDGSGYYHGVKSESISIFAQIIAVADTFHAMTSERLYRTKESPFKVIEMINESEFGKFNIQVVNALINLVADLPIGTKIELSNLERGEIIFINRFAPTRPMIRLGNTGEIVDLSGNRSFYISRILTN